jgi:hypothetical protein
MIGSKVIIKYPLKSVMGLYGIIVGKIAFTDVYVVALDNGSVDKYNSCWFEVVSKSIWPNDLLAALK